MAWFPKRAAFAYLLMVAATPAMALQQTTAGASASITPQEAHRAAAVLEDEHKRAETLRTLKVIADSAPAASTSTAGTAATPAAAPVAAPSGTQVAAASAAVAPAAASTVAAPAKDAPLEADGLTARALRDIGEWVDGLGGQLDQVKAAALSLPVVIGGALEGAATGPHRVMLLKLLGILAGVFVVGLGLEWVLVRLLRRPRNALLAHAEAADAAELRKQVADARASAEAARQANVRAAETDVAEGRAGTSEPAPTGDNVAVVVTHRDGVERVEAVPVAAGDGGSGGGGAATTDTAPAPAPATAPARPDTSGTHLRTLRHLPFAVASLLLDLLPVALFFLAAALLLRSLAADGSKTYLVTSGFIDAYVTVRAGMAILRLLVSPVGHGLRLLQMGQGTSKAVVAWVRRILVIGAFGIALADAMGHLGGGAPERTALIKLVSLVVHVCVVILIFRVRRPVAAHIRAAAGAEGTIASARNWLSQVWAFAASVLVMGLWVVWALGVEDGFPKLLHFVGASAAVIVVTRVLSVVVLGAVTRAFEPKDAGKDATGAPAASAAASRIDVHRYYPLARAVVTLVMTVCGLIALLQVWGVDALAWFSSGTLGRSVASACLTILVAAVFAILVWELANAGVNRRLSRWVDQGDLVRAARLRTLVPMLRTCLLVVMVLIVGLTALSQIGINTAPLLAGASIIGVALGFGSQKLVQDFITGIFLLMENAMQVGDSVTVAGVSGSVEYLSIRTVRIRGSDGSLYIVPFSSVTTVNNTNRGLGNAALKISLGYDTDVGQAIDELKKLGADMRSDPAFKDLILADIEVWGVDAVDGSMFTLAGQMRCTDKGRWGVQREMNRRILERFRAIGIPVANPHANVLLTQAGVSVTPVDEGDASGS